MTDTAIARITQMEQYFDTLICAEPSQIREDPVLLAHRETLLRYYESGQWLCDYELDEQGLLPPDLKRGILSQDALYDFLEQEGMK